jgi:transposase
MKRNTMIGWTEREFSAAADLSQEVGARELLAVVLEEVLAVGPGAWSSGEKLPEFRPQMMLTLVTYAYSVGIYGSRDLEDAMDTDPTIRYICARSFPDWVSIRRFRRRNRDVVEQCLTRVLSRGWLQQWRGDDAAPGLEVAARSAARERLDTAALMDGADSD